MESYNRRYSLPFCFYEKKFRGPDEIPEEKPSGPSPYISKVLDYHPAPGQFVNLLPKYENGDNQEIMNAKACEALKNNNQGTVSLGGYGGYIVVGFDHTIENVSGSHDFKILGNAFNNNSEPGIVRVAYDQNKNGIPDENEWYELAGSEHSNPATIKIIISLIIVRQRMCLLRKNNISDGVIAKDKKDI